MDGGAGLPFMCPGSARGSGSVQIRDSRATEHTTALVSMASYSKHQEYDEPR